MDLGKCQLRISQRNTVSSYKNHVRFVRLNGETVRDEETASTDLYAAFSYACPWSLTKTKPTLHKIITRMQMLAMEELSYIANYFLQKFGELELALPVFQ